MTELRCRESFPDRLLDAIYAGVTQEHPWVNALELLRVWLDSGVACVRISARGPHPREYLFASGPTASPEAIVEWEARSTQELLPVSLTVGEPVLINHLAMRPFGSIPELYERYDIAYSATILLRVDNGIAYHLCVSRSASGSIFSAQELESLRAISGHFNRALILRQDFLKSRVVNEFQSDTLDRLGIAAILVGSKGDLTVLSDTARRMLTNSEWLRIRGGRLHAVDERDDRLFQSIMKEALGSELARQSRAMLIRHGGEGRDLNLLVSGRRSHCLISGRDESCALVFVGRSSVADDADLKVLQELFSFTPAEARLALGLAKGKPLGDVESEMNIRHNTARAHLRSMFLKTDVSRQSELVHLLANSLVPLGRALQQNTRTAASRAVN